MRYTQLLVGLILSALLLVGCQHGQVNDQQEEILRLLNYGESGLMVALTVAEVMGGDPVVIEQARAGATEAFDAAYALVSIRMSTWDKAELLAATDALEEATTSVIAVCRIAGVSQNILSMAEDSAIQAYKTLRDVINALPDRVSFFRSCTLPSLDAGSNSRGALLWC